MLKREFLPCEWYELGAIEHWLGDMAREGWALSRMNGTWVVFERTAPRVCRYRFYPCRPKSEMDGGGQWELFHEMGWEYVCTVQRAFVIFCCTDPAAPELCTDPVVEADSYRQIYKDLRWRLMWLLLYPFLYTGMYWFVLDARKSELSPVHLFAGGFEVLAALLFLFAVSVAGAAHSFQAIRRMRGRLAHGEPIDHEAAYPKRRRGLSNRVWNVLSLTVLVLSLIWLNLTDQQPIEQMEPPVPAPLLANLEGEGFTYGLRAWKDSSIETRSTLLSECFAETRQAGDGESSLLWLDSTYIRVRIPQLAAPLFDALTVAMVEDETSNAIFGEAGHVSVLENAGFDEMACFLRRREFEDGAPAEQEWLAIVRRGSQLLSAQYTGEQPLERLLEEMDDTLKRFEEGQHG